MDSIALTKPGTKVCGEKRKIPTTEADCEGNIISSNKRVKGWNCVLCNVATTSEIDLQYHIQGRKHVAKVTQEKISGTTGVVKKCNSSVEKPITVLVSSIDTGANEAGVVAKSSEKSNYWCEICNVAATCATSMASHEAGKKHLAKLRDYIPPKDVSMSCSTKPLTQYELLQTLKVVAVVTNIGDESTETANTAKGSTRDPGVEMCFEGNGKSSENIDCVEEGEVVVEETVNPKPEEPIITLGSKKAIENEHGRSVISTEKGNVSGQFKFWYQISQVDTCPGGVLCDGSLSEEACFIEEIAEDLKGSCTIEGGGDLKNDHV